VKWNVRNNIREKHGRDFIYLFACLKIKRQERKKENTGFMQIQNNKECLTDHVQR